MAFFGFTRIPSDFGQGGSGLGDGSPNVRTVLQEHQTALEGLTVAADGLADLEALKPAADGRVECWVSSLRDVFYLDRTSAATLSAGTIHAAAGGGRWVRRCAGDLIWQLKTTWSYDAAGGSVEGDGSVDDPINSIAELIRRVTLPGNPVTTTVTVTLAASLSDSEATMFDSLVRASPRQWILA